MKLHSNIDGPNLLTTLCNFIMLFSQGHIAYHGFIIDTFNCNLQYITKF